MIDLNNPWGTCTAQHLTPDLGSGHDLSLLRSWSQELGSVLGLEHA